MFRLPRRKVCPLRNEYLERGKLVESSLFKGVEHEAFILNSYDSCALLISGKGKNIFCQGRSDFCPDLKDMNALAKVMTHPEHIDSLHTFIMS